MFYWIVYNICWDISFSFLSHFLSFSSFLPLTLFLFLSFPFFPQAFAWLDLSWNKSNSTQSWTLSFQNRIPFLISSIGINLLFFLLDLPQLYQCFWFSFSKKQLLFYYPNKLYFCCFLFLFQFIYTFYFLYGFFLITLHFKSFLYKILWTYIWFTMLCFRCISQWFNYTDTLFFFRFFSNIGYYMIQSLLSFFLSFFFLIDGLGLDLTLFK